MFGDNSGVGENWGQHPINYDNNYDCQGEVRYFFTIVIIYNMLN